MSISVYNPITKRLTQIAGNSNPSSYPIGELEDVDISSPTDGQVLKYDATNEAWVNVDDDSEYYIDQNVVLSANEATTVTFNDSKILETSVVDVYTTVGIVPFQSMEILSGTCIVVFPPQGSALNVTVRIYIR